tara:strand:+ start:58 stop:543 length:486 start_codon:yes stop_codon:yes gene_type:complete
MIKKILIVTFLCTFFMSHGYSASSGSTGNGSSGDDRSNYERGYYIIKKAKKLEKKGKIDKAQKTYKRALKYFVKANNEKPGDPDILNYLGFATRKIGDFENAEVYYLMGLQQDPNHVGINEYLGELYIETNRKELALERLAILKDCKCKEYNELKDLINKN